MVVVWAVFVMLLAVSVGVYIISKRHKWKVILPLDFAVFLVLEIILDYILQIDFRNTWLIGPYLLLYYVAIMGMIGYAFRIGKVYGFLTLITYFSSQVAAVFSYVNVDHR
jgi:hypothetical protein